MGSSSNRYAPRLPQQETKPSTKQLAPTDPILGPENLLKTGFAQKGLPSSLATSIELEQRRPAHAKPDFRQENLLDFAQKSLSGMLVGEMPAKHVHLSFMLLKECWFRDLPLKVAASFDPNESHKQWMDRFAAPCVDGFPVVPQPSRRIHKDRRF